MYQEESKQGDPPKKDKESFKARIEKEHKEKK